MKTKSFKVTLPICGYASAADLEKYVRDAVIGWCGQYTGDLDDWRDELADNRSKIKVTRLNCVRTKRHEKRSESTEST